MQKIISYMNCMLCKTGFVWATRVRANAHLNTGLSIGGKLAPIRVGVEVRAGRRQRVRGGFHSRS